MKIKCACGKMLQIPDSLAGKKAKCPSCGHIISVANNGAAPSGGKRTVQCSCGQKLAVPAEAAGKQVRCPTCKAVISVPAEGASAPEPTPQPEPEPEPSDEEMLFELDFGNHVPAPRKSKDDENDDEFEVAGAKCPNCGADLAAAAQFCVHCGTHISTGTQADGVNMAEIKERQETSRKFKFMIVVGVAVVVAALVITAVLVGPWKKGKKSRPSRPPVETPQAPSEPVETSQAQPPGETRRDRPGGVGVGPLEPKGREGYLEINLYAPGRARVKTDIMSINQSIKAFQVDPNHDRLPKSLDELRAEYAIPDPPDGVVYEYNPQTGEVTAYRLRDRQPQEGASE